VNCKSPKALIINNQILPITDLWGEAGTNYLTVKNALKTTGTFKGKSNKLGGGGRFAQLAEKAGGGKKGAAIAAAIGRKKYGAKKMASMAAKGKKK
jgi:hypothetical protein